ncbi:MAG: transcriptional regulator [Paenibacillus sp.]|nr:transcriptional regulator [Paenibacillus sp.]
MINDFLHIFQPHIVDVKMREELFWQRNRFAMLRDDTEYHSFVLVHEGEGTLELNGNRYELKRGAVFCVPMASRMYLRTQPVKLLKYVSVLFSYGTLHWEGGKGVWSQSNDVSLPVPDVIYFREEPEIIDCFQQLHELWNEQLGVSLWLCVKQFKLLLERVLRKQADESSPLQHHWLLIEQAVQHIRSHYHEPFDRREWAKKLSLSPGHLTVLFKQYTGYAPMPYIVTLRMERAKQLLRTTELPIRRIAEEVGYPDPLYFSRVFSKEIGISPARFRQS